MVIAKSLQPRIYKTVEGSSPHMQNIHGANIIVTAGSETRPLDTDICHTRLQSTQKHAQGYLSSQLVLNTTFGFMVYNLMELPIFCSADLSADQQTVQVLAHVHIHTYFRQVTKVLPATSIFLVYTSSSIDKSVIMITTGKHGIQSTQE